MAAFTVFFCGTCSNRLDVNNKDYPKGELVSTLASHHKGEEFFDWIICDGPGSGNLHEEEKWVTPPEYSTANGIATGAGWEENVAHAMAVIKNEYEWKPTKLSQKDFDVLKSHGVDVELKQGGSWYWRTYALPERMTVTRQELVKEIKKRKGGGLPATVNIVGWSRGGVSAIMLANAMAKDQKTAGIPVNIFAIDPVPGAGQFQTHRCVVPANVKNFVGVYARDEHSRGFAPIVPEVKSGKPLFLPFRGKHATLPGNGAIDGNSGTQKLPQSGLLVRDLAEKMLTRWGTALDKTLNLKAADIDKHYEQILKDAKDYDKLQKIGYWGGVQDQDGERYIGLGSTGKGAAFSAAKGDNYQFKKGLSLTDDEVRAILGTR